MKLGALVKLILRANRAGRAPVEPWEEDTTEKDAERFARQLARMMPENAQDIRDLAFPPTVRMQVWCDTYACFKGEVVDVPRHKIPDNPGECHECGAQLHAARVEAFVFVHPNLFDVWTLEAPCPEAAAEKFAMQWEEKCGHLTSSEFGQGKVQLEDDYEAS